MNDKPKKKRTPSLWVVLELFKPDAADDKQPGVEQWSVVGQISATSAKGAIESAEAMEGQTYVAVSTRNWRPYTAEVPPTPQAVLKPVKKAQEGGGE